MSEEAPEILHGIVDVPQPEVAMLLESGYLYLEMGKLKEAEDIFVGVCSLLPNSDVPRVALGNLHFSQGRFQRALKFHQEGLKVRPDSALAKAHIGECLLFLRKTDNAIEALNEAMNMAPESATANFAKALIEAHEAGSIPR